MRNTAWSFSILQVVCTVMGWVMPEREVILSQVKEILAPSYWHFGGSFCSEPQASLLRLFSSGSIILQDCARCGRWMMSQSDTLE